jgi:hypothetical protein
MRGVVTLYTRQVCARSLPSTAPGKKKFQIIKATAVLRFAPKIRTPRGRHASSSPPSLFAQLHFLYEDCTGVMARLSNFTAHAAPNNDRNTLEHDKEHARSSRSTAEALMRNYDFDCIDDDPLYAPGWGKIRGTDPHLDQAHCNARASRPHRKPRPPHHVHPLCVTHHSPRTPPMTNRHRAARCSG